QTEYLHHFFEAVDKNLNETLRGVPLLLAGVREEIALYKKTAKYQHILEAECHGNPEHAPLEQVARHAQAAATREYRSICERALNALLADRSRVTEPMLILAAAAEGRIRRLFVAEAARLTPPSGTANLSPKEDLFNAAVVEALRTGAEIFTFS